MKAWNFKVKRDPKEISKKIESALGSRNGFVFNMDHDKNDSVTFKVRKRVLYAWYIIFLNYVIVNGKLLKTAAKNETDVEISFTQHFLFTLILFTYMFAGLGFLIMLILRTSSDASMYILGGILLAIGIVLWFEKRKRFKMKVQEYKTLISEILEF